MQDSAEVDDSEAPPAEHQYPDPPDYTDTLHVFDCRDFDRTETLIEIQAGRTRDDAKQNISDQHGDIPAFREATETPDGYLDADLEEGLTASLDDREYPSLVYLGTLTEAAPYLQRMFQASDREVNDWRFSMPLDVESERLVDWLCELYEASNSVA